MNVVLELLYPRECAVCGQRRPSAGRYLCTSCFSSLQLLGRPCCECCGYPVGGVIEGKYLCISCADAAPAFKHARSLGHYDGILAELIQSFKYHGSGWLAPDLGRFMARAVEVWYGDLEFDAVVPVPLYRRRMQERGFNQAALLAAEVAALLGLPLAGRYLLRTRDTATQTNLTAGERLGNVKDAFTVPVSRARWLRGRRLLLVDDVMTTGATANACADALVQSGAARVDVFTAARAV